MTATSETKYEQGQWSLHATPSEPDDDDCCVFLHINDGHTINANIFMGCRFEVPIKVSMQDESVKDQVIADLNIKDKDMAKDDGCGFSAFVKISVQSVDSYVITFGKSITGEVMNDGKFTMTPVQCKAFIDEMRDCLRNPNDVEFKFC